MQQLTVYILIILTVAAIAALARLIGSPRPRNGRSSQTGIPSDQLEDSAQMAPGQSVLAKVD